MVQLVGQVGGDVWWRVRAAGGRVCLDIAQSQEVARLAYVSVYHHMSHAGS